MVMGRFTNETCSHGILSFVSHIQNEISPSGNDKQLAIEHGPVEKVSFPKKKGGSFHSHVNCKRLPEGGFEQQTSKSYRYGITLSG